MADLSAGPSTREREEEARGHPWRLLVLLIALTAVGPLSLNILTPAMPGLITTFGAEAGTVQLTLSLICSAWRLRSSCSAPCRTVSAAAR